MKLSHAKLLQKNFSHTKVARVSLRPKALFAAFLSIACVLSLGVDVGAIAAIPAAAKDKKPKQDPTLKGLPITELAADEAILHAMNRLAYGPRPGDVERVRQMGLAKWIDQQLTPNSIDDRTLNARLENLPTLSMSSAQLIAEYPQPKPAALQPPNRAGPATNSNPQSANADAGGATVAPPSTSAAVGQSASNNPPEVNVAD